MYTVHILNLVWDIGMNLCFDSAAASVPLYFVCVDLDRTPPGPANGTATGEEAESTYAVFSGRHYNNHCCFDVSRPLFYAAATR